MRLNNYKSTDRSFKTKKREIQKLFHGHYIQLLSLYIIIIIVFSIINAIDFILFHFIFYC